MVALVETWESSIGERFPKPGRSWMLANDPISLDSLPGNAEAADFGLVSLSISALE